MRKWLVWAGTLASVAAAACGGTYHPPLTASGPTPDSGAAPSADTVPASREEPGSDGGPGGAAAARPREAASTDAARTPSPASAEPPPASAGTATAARNGVIRIGAVNPLSGPIGPLGQAHTEGAAAIFAAVNDAGGVGGARIEFLVRDDQFDPVQGRRHVQDLIAQHRVFAFAGILSPTTLQAALPDIHGAGTPVLPTDAAANHFDSPLLFPTFQQCNRNVAGNIAHMVEARGRTRGAFVYIDLATGRECTEYAQSVLTKLGGTVAYEGTVQPAAPDCTAHIVSARARGADFLFLLTENLGIVKCVSAREQQGWDALVTVTANVVDDPTLVRGLGRGAEGLLSSTPYTGVHSPEFEALCATALRRYYPDAAPQFYHEVGCLGAVIMVQALRDLGPGATQEAFVRHLEAVDRFSTGGLSPDVVYRPGAHQPFDLTAPVEIVDGRWTRVGPLFRPPTP